ncbi:DUF4305 domain-containing protein [Bacillaceae bacterium Marseille-Q3522]|nr:DUF4305 domain-containing protein [Bacillaceae bacterium Marseille-Q3522]
MKQIPLLTGFVYLFFGVCFCVIGYWNLTETGEWSIISYFLAALATFDIGAGIKIITRHTKGEK